ncbi:hypothetical protein ABPG74_003813 [Tetrahymena malaccensis]
MSKIIILVFIFGVLFSQALELKNLETYTFEQYAKEFNKNYEFDSEEYQLRKSIFQRNLAEIIHFNDLPNQTYKKGVNQFTDQTQEELKEKTLGYSKNMNKIRPFRNLSVKSIEVTEQQLKDLPTSVDWRQRGVITPVKDQGHCGSCWAQASTATIEAHAAINSGQLKILSTQQLVSCVPNIYQCGGTGGCQGAISELAFNYVQLYGLTSEFKYPYQSYFSGITGNCTYDQSTTTPEVTLDGYVKLQANDYNALLYAVATIGPLAVAVDGAKWHSYKSGVYNGCDYSQNIDVNHVVVLEGYGTDPELGDYWLIRNSWGTSFGENGYIRLARESKVTCGIDYSPLDGQACAGQNIPTKVCGQCGVAYDSAYPINVQVIG